MNTHNQQQKLLSGREKKTKLGRNKKKGKLTSALGFPHGEVPALYLKFSNKNTIKQTKLIK